MPKRPHNVMEWKKEQAEKLRLEENMTYKEIADTMGVSKAYVGILLKDATKRRNFHRWSDDSAPFPNLVRWMNENQFTKTDLQELLGYSVSSNSMYVVCNRLKKGKLQIDEVDKLLDLTGIEYEKLFRRERK